MKPNQANFCGGAFSDWLEVNLTDKCNGTCSWCIEKQGYHPKTHVDWTTLAEKIEDYGAHNVILLGGEPTLYRDIAPLIARLANNGHDVWITTNGSSLSPEYVRSLSGIHGVNISIHHYDLSANKNITGIDLDERMLTSAIDILHGMGASIRLNCNCIIGEIDSEAEIRRYISFAKDIHADKVRFAELKQSNGKFVDLAKIFNYRYGLNDNPFIHGCIHDVIINNMPVNLRQMCGIQTPRRKRIERPEQVTKQVLYYDGCLYNGWQRKDDSSTHTSGDGCCY